MIKRTDANQKKIVEMVRKLPGASITSTHTIGKGFPDLVIGYKGINYLIEIKDGKKPPSARKLTPDEVKFHHEWSGQISIIKNLDELLQIIL
jgi:hypothetical protein